MEHGRPFTGWEAIHGDKRSTIVAIGAPLTGRNGAPELAQPWQAISARRNRSPARRTDLRPGRTLGAPPMARNRPAAVMATEADEIGSMRSQSGTGLSDETDPTGPAEPDRVRILIRCRSEVIAPQARKVSRSSRLSCRRISRHPRGWPVPRPVHRRAEPWQPGRCRMGER